MGHGTKYNRELRTKDIAALVRKEIAADVKAGVLPPIKVSVRYEAFSGGTAIRVSVTDIGPVPLLNPEWVSERLRVGLKSFLDYATERRVPQYTEEARALLVRLSAYAAAYNRDDSDSMTDYFSVNFYGGDATFDWELVRDAEHEAFFVPAQGVAS